MGPIHPPSPPPAARPSQGPPGAGGLPPAAPQASNISMGRATAALPTVRRGPSSEKDLEYSLVDLFRLTVKEGGSDLHLTTGQSPMIRIHGALQPTALPVLRAMDIKKLIYEILEDDHRATFEEKKELDCAYEVPDLSRFRVNIFLNRLGLGGVFRVIPSKIKTIEELGLPQILSELTNRNRGLVLVTGPTGSGKSTTLAAMVDAINRKRQEHILTIEDPIEFVHRHQRCIVNQREIGPNTKSFSNALRAALREDPDIILVGELRDYETISLALTAAETGHLVFATLHTPSAAQSIDRIIDVFPAHQQEQIRTQLADALVAVIAQQLLPMLSGNGRIVALEILVTNPAISNLIRENKTFQILSIMQTGRQLGMITMDQCLENLVKKRLVDPAEAYKRCYDKKAFEQYRPK